MDAETKFGPHTRGIRKPDPNSRYFNDWNIVDMPFDSIDMETKDAAAPVSRLVARATRMGKMNAVATIPVCCRPSRNNVGPGGLSFAAYSRSGGRMHTKKSCRTLIYLMVSDGV